MQSEFTTTDLEAYLDESLPSEKMAAIEEALRRNQELQKRLMAVNGRRDAGVHSLGEIWRRHRVSCPSRQELGSYLMGVLPKGATDYVKFHLETIECRYCNASVCDLRAQQAAAEAGAAERRRQKYFQSSAGYLRKK